MNASSSTEIVLTFSEIVAFLRRNVRLISMTTCGIAAFAAIVSLIIPSQYTAKCTIVPPKEESDLSSLIASQFGGIGSLAASASGIKIKDPNEYYIGILKSTNVADTLIHAFDLKNRFDVPTLHDSRIKLALHSNLESRKDGLISISYTDKEPEIAAEISNAYSKQLMRVLTELQRDNAKIRRSFFEKEMFEMQTKLGSSENRLRDYLHGQKLLDVPSALRVQIEENARLEAEIFTKEIAQKAMSSRLSPQNPDLQQIQIELAELRKRKKLGNASAFGREPHDSGLLGVGTEYVRLYRDFKYQETLYEVLSKQYELAKLDEAKAGTLVQLIDSATPPEKRSSPKRRAIVVVFGFLGFFVSLLVAFYSENKNKLIDFWKSTEGAKAK